MCGIIGYFHQQREGLCSNDKCYELFSRSFDSLSHRGPDSSGWTEIRWSLASVDYHGWIGAHRLAMVGEDVQPLRKPSINACLVANCEIYNYEKWVDSTSIKNVSDTRTLLEQLSRLVPEKDVISGAVRFIKNLDGVFSFIYMTNNHLIVARDFWGVKPLYYGKSKDGKELVFASELKSLDFFENIISKRRFPPGNILLIKLGNGNEDILGNGKYQRFVPTYYEKGRHLAHQTRGYGKALRTLQIMLEEALIKRIRNLDDIAILLSGGVDSSVLAKMIDDLARDTSIDVRGFVVGSVDSKDGRFVRYLQSIIKFPVTYVMPTNELSFIEDILVRVVNAIEIDDLKQLTIAFPLALACSAIREQGFKAVISGQGADELFGGYYRYREAFVKDPKLAQQLMERDLDNISQNNLERDDKVAMSFGLELRLPYLDLKLSSFVRALPIRWKLKRPVDPGHQQEFKADSPEAVETKVMLRDLAKKIHLPLPIVMRKKTAFQYGSGTIKLLRLLAKKKGYKKLRNWYGSLIEQISRLSPDNTF